MTRDDEYAAHARDYLEADDDVKEAERQMNQMRIALDAAKRDRDAIHKKLAGFVGANIRTRNAVVGYRLVRTEYSGDRTTAGERVDVSVEDVSLSPVAAGGAAEGGHES